MSELQDALDLWDINQRPTWAQPLVEAARKYANPAGTLVVRTYPPEFGMTGGRDVLSDSLMPWAGADGISTDLPVGRYLIVAVTEDK